jgi:hypothetical protein
MPKSLAPRISARPASSDWSHHSAPKKALKARLICEGFWLKLGNQGLLVSCYSILWFNVNHLMNWISRETLQL